MATGSVRSRNSRYQARFRGDHGTETSRTFARKGDAERWLNDQLARLNRGEWVDPAAGRLTFGQYASQWLGQQPHRPSTAAATTSRLRCHLLPLLADRPLGSLRPSDIKALVATLSRTLSPTTVEAVYRLLATILRSAVDDRHIASTPCRGVALPRPDGRRVEPLRGDEVAAIVDAMQPNLRAAAVAAAGLGLRQGELFGLTVDRVDWLRRSVRVDRQLVTVAGVPPHLGPCKTPASVRTIPAPATVLEALTAHLQAHDEGPDRLLFSTRTASPVRRNLAAEAWRRAATRAGLPGSTGWHELRHFYASLLIEAGESVKVVQARLGHKSATETLDTYGHLWPDNEEATRSAVDRLLGAALAAEHRAPRTSVPGR